MKVAFVAQPYDGIFPPNQNSIGLIAYNTAMEMARQVELTLLGHRGSNPAPHNDLPFKVSLVSSRTDVILQYVACHYPKWAQQFGIVRIADAYPGFARSIAKNLDRSAFDVVHVMNYWSWCRLFKGTASKRRVVLEMQAEWLSQMDERQVRAELESADAVAAVSDHIARLFRESFPTYRGKVFTAYNGVDVDAFRPGPVENDHSNGRPLTILFVGRVSPEKGIHTLIEAFAQLVSREPRARLVIVGSRATLREDFIVSISADPLVRALRRFYDGSLSSDYQYFLDGLISRLGVGGNVEFVGRVPHKDLPNRYRASTLLVNPSLSESFGISIVEAMACGVPVVGTRVGGMLETVRDGETGLLVEPERPDLLAEAMLAVLNDPKKAREMGAQGRVRAVNQFSWRARAERLVSAYRTLP